MKWGRALRARPHILFSNISFAEGPLPHKQSLLEREEFFEVAGEVVEEYRSKVFAIPKILLPGAGTLPCKNSCLGEVR